MASSRVASAALVLILAPASGPPGTVVLGHTAGQGAFPTAVDPLLTYLVRAAAADGIVDARDPRLIEVGKLVVDRAGNGHIRFVVPAVDAGPYVVMVHCPSCALYSRGRTILPVADFEVIQALPRTDVPSQSSPGPPGTFADVVRRSRLIVLVAIRQRADGGFTFDVERVLKGSAPRQLVYPPVAATPPLGSWRRAVIAFADPATDDYRAPTIAWHVTLDGRIDPERYQQYAGLPITLAAVLDWFGLPATDTRPVASALTGGPVGGALALLFIGALAGLVVAVRPIRRGRQRGG
jgi:hypothetical protein